MRLEPRCVIRQQGIRARMRLVKAISRELQNQVEQLPRLVLRVLLLRRARHEQVTLLRHRLGILLSHGSAQQISTTQRIPGDRRRNLHHLLLVHDDAQRLLQQRFQFRQHVLHRSPAPLTFNEVVNHAALDRTRPVQRIQRGQVLHGLYRRSTSRMPPDSN